MLWECVLIVTIDNVNCILRLKTQRRKDCAVRLAPTYTSERVHVLITGRLAGVPVLGVFYADVPYVRTVITSALWLASLLVDIPGWANTRTSAHQSDVRPASGFA